MRILALLAFLMLFAVPLALEHGVLHLPPSASPQTAENAALDSSAEVSAEAEPQAEREEEPAQQSAAVVSEAPAPKPSAQENPAPAAQQTPPESPQKTPAQETAELVARIEAEVLLRSNAERAQAGLEPLSADASLRAIAWAHSADMLANDYFSHDNQAGCNSSCRATNAGYRWSTIGENIYMSDGYRIRAEETAEMIVDGWMNSPGHRANILHTGFTRSGVGIVVAGETLYATALYAKPR